MVDNIDKLSIEISASVDSAAKSIGQLNSRLSALSSSLSRINGRGINDFTKEMRKVNSAVSGIKKSGIESVSALGKAVGTFGRKNVQTATMTLPSLTTEITKLATSLNGIGKINFDNAQFSDLVSSMSKLGGANMQRAITVIPQFTTELMKMFNELSRAPEIAGNTIQMTNALGNLASSLRTSSGASKNGGGFNNIYYAFNRLDGGLKKTIKRISHTGREFLNMYQKMERLRKKTIDLAQAFGKFYATYWLFLRAFRGVGGFIKSAMEYVESLNYFDETMKQIVKKADLSAWSELGYESAEAYANSFYNEATKLFKKLSGYEVDANGKLVNAMSTSLGLDPKAVMSAYTQFAQMSSSMGISSQTSMKMAEALTLIGTDLSSIRDIAFSDTWEALSSGLTGTARALDQYGINLRVSGLNQELVRLGINATANSLSQADKAILRTITILDSSEFAWTDLIDTIDTGANQLRILQASAGNLSRTLGQIFLPVVVKVLPYVTALVNALQRLAQWFVTLLGFDDFDWGGISSAGDAMSDLLDSTDETTNSVNKLKNALMGIDELNVLDDKNSSGGAGGGAGGVTGLLEDALNKVMSDYLMQWNLAYDSLEDRTQLFADNVQRIFKESGIKGVGKYFADSIADGLESIDWNKIWRTSSLIGSGTADFLNGFFDKRLFEDVGMTIANTIKTGINTGLSFTTTFDWSKLGDSIGSGLNGFFRNYPWKEKLELAKTLGKGLSDTINSAVRNIDVESAGNYLFSKIGSIIDFSYNLVTNISWKDMHEKAKGVMKQFMDNMSKVDAETGKNGWQKLGISLGTGISEALTFAFEDIPWGDLLSGLWTGFKEAFDIIIKEHPIALTLTLASLTFAKAMGFAMNMATLTTLFGGGVSTVAGVSGVGAGLGGFLLSIPIALTLGVTTLMFGGINDAKISEAFAPFKEKVMASLNDFNQEVQTTSMAGADALSSAIRKTADDTSEDFVSVFDNVFDTINTMETESQNTIQNTSISLKSYLQTIRKDGEKEIGSLSDTVGCLNGVVNETFSEEVWTSDGMSKGISNTLDGAISAFKEKWNAFSKEANDKLSLSIMTDGLLAGIQAGASAIKVQVPSFSTGGMPEDGLFFANHNELVGGFSNGKTAVANNDQIVSGIQNGVRSAVAEILAPYLSQIADNTRATANKDLTVNIGDRDIARANKRGQRSLGMTIITQT
jgi:hypothetical protein